MHYPLADCSASDVSVVAAVRSKRAHTPGKLSRNSPCPCGSGKKFKRCCHSVHNGVPPSGLLDAEQGEDEWVPGGPLPNPFKSEEPTLDTPLGERNWQQVHLVMDNVGGKQVYMVVLYSSEWLQAKGLKADDRPFVDFPEYDVRGEGWVTAIEPSPERAQYEGQVVTYARGTATARTPPGQPREPTYFGERIEPAERPLDPARARRIHFRLDKGEGDYVEAVLLRDADWVAANASTGGDWLFVNLPEQGAQGWAQILSNQPCPPVEEGPGRLVTGWFKHSRGLPGELRLRGVAKAIGITATHPVWSVDRRAWVPAGELCQGERVQGKDGPLAVESFTNGDKEEPVYNIEVEGDHCYRVGDHGLLVHNASAPCACPSEWQVPTPAGENYRPTFVDRPYQGHCNYRPSGVGRPTYNLNGMSGVDAVLLTMYFTANSLNSMGKPIVANAKSKPSEKAKAWVNCVVGVQGDIVGHVVTESWGGPGKLDQQRSIATLRENSAFFNVVPYGQSFNQRYRVDVEDRFVNLVVMYGQVCAKVTFGYPSQNDPYPARPTSIEAEFQAPDPTSSSGWRVVATANIS